MDEAFEMLVGFLGKEEAERYREFSEKTREVMPRTVEKFEAEQEAATRKLGDEFV